MRKINLPTLVLGGLLNLGILSCSAPSEKIKPDTLEYKLNVGRDSQTYMLEIKKGNLFVGINPWYHGGNGGCIIEIYDEKSENEAIKVMLELHDGKNESYAGEMRVHTPEFFIQFNKKQGAEYIKRVHVNGKLYDKFFTIIDADGDGNPETIYYGNDTIELYNNDKIPKSFGKLSPLENYKDLIAGAMELFLKSRSYMNEIGDIESLKL